ncbi:nucleotide exchange factor GrpE [Algoriphagus vanfongensis]|uniref:nucleotide exchange factor GrpE n=1 Tax=Algoriphagus vanfongensis TaxID=426371 RepID=UPI00041278A3|nr:nucleotide exchange factor GrpE [Algoriphagus vanfongensis]
MKNKDKEVKDNQQEVVEESAEKEVKAEETATEVQNEENPLAKLEAEVAETRDKYLRLYSDFENFRKRNAKERLDLIKTASEEVLRDLIPVVDDFERASKANEAEEDAQKIREGNLLIFNKLMKILENKGLKPMEDLIGNPFDADTQEAITQIPAPNEEMKGKVIDVVEKGYTLGDKVVRFAKVVTGA